MKGNNDFIKYAQNQRNSISNNNLLISPAKQPTTYFNTQAISLLAFYVYVVLLPHLTLWIAALCSLCGFICLTWRPQKTTILSLGSIYRLVFIMQTDCVLRDVVVNSYTQFIFNNLREYVLLNSKLFIENNPLHYVNEKKILVINKEKSKCSFGTICKS